MNNRLLLPIAIAAVTVIAISACNDSSTPTTASRDLLVKSESVPTLGKSEYGLVLADDDASSDDDLIVPVPAIDAHKDSVAGDRHIRLGDDDSKYKPANYEHIPNGNPNRSKYKPERWEHRGATTTPIEDRTLYVPHGVRHIRSGANKSYYQ